jgi:hypothetical protein
MMNTVLYTVASGPAPSDELVVTDPDEVEAERAIAAAELVWVEVPGVGLALVPADPVERARVLRVEI